jgi:superfamily II DNA/RNA helicase
LWCVEFYINLVNQRHDVIGQAQTGTGKTAAFALPLIDQIDIKLNAPQLLILAFLMTDGIVAENRAI